MINYNKVSKDSFLDTEEFIQFVGKDPYVAAALMSSKDFAFMQVIEVEGTSDIEIIDPIFSMLPNTSINIFSAHDFKDVNNDDKQSKVVEQLKHDIIYKVTRISESINDHLSKRYPEATYADVIYMEPLVEFNDDIEQRKAVINVSTLCLFILHLKSPSTIDLFHDPECEELSFENSCDGDCAECNDCEDEDD